MNASARVGPGVWQPPRVVSCVLLALALSTSAASAAVLPADSVPEHVLAGLRGGLEVAGLKMDMAANLRTYIDNRLALETTARLERYGDRHRWVEQRVAAHDVEPASAGARSDSAITTASASRPAVTAKTVSGEVVRVDLPVAGSNGVGSTRVTHLVGPDQVFGTVANTANGRSVQQIMDMELRVLNFRSYSEQIHNAVRARQMGKAIAR